MLYIISKKFQKNLKYIFLMLLTFVSPFNLLIKIIGEAYASPNKDNYNTLFQY